MVVAGRKPKRDPDRERAGNPDRKTERECVGESSRQPSDKPGREAARQPDRGDPRQVEGAVGSPTGQRCSGLSFRSRGSQPTP